MALRTLLLLLVGFAGGFTLGCSPATPSCSPSTCGGCCDATGKCQSGATADACGIDGASCGRCGAGTVCAMGECRAGGTGGGSGGGTGTGGGSSTGGGTATGGGTNTGGGSATGCRTVTSSTQFANAAVVAYLPFTSGQGHFNVAVFSANQPDDSVRFEVVYPNDVGPSIPTSGSFAGKTYRQCLVCAVYNEGCSVTNCSKRYLATSGTYSVTRADPAAEGRIAGSAANLRFVEWNFTSDIPVTGGGCIELASFGPFDIGWTADGGIVP